MIHCICSLKTGFNWYLVRLIKCQNWALWGVPWGQTQQGVPGRHPFLHMNYYILHVHMLRCWYLVRLIKMLWAAALGVYVWREPGGWRIRSVRLLSVQRLVIFITGGDDNE